MNQCWLPICAIMWHSHENKFTMSAQATILNNEFENYTFEITATSPGANELTHWGLVTHKCVSKLTIIVSDNGLTPDRRQAIIWTSAGILLIEPLGTNFSEILIGIQTFSFKKNAFENVVWKMAASCLGLNELSIHQKYPCNRLSPVWHQAICWTKHINFLQRKYILRYHLLTLFHFVSGFMC